MSVAPKLIRDMLDELVAQVEAIEARSQAPRGCSPDMAHGYESALATNAALLEATVLPKLRLVKMWANNEAKVRDLARRLGGGK